MKYLTAWFGKRTSPRAQTITEFSMVVTVFLLLVFGIAELGIAVFNYNSLCSAAREAVRYAIVHSPTGPNPATTSEIQQVAIDHAPALNLTSSDITVSWPADPRLSSQKDAQIAIAYTYKLQIPFLPAVSLQLSSSSQMLVSQ